jgi:hypothetical protein
VLKKGTDRSCPQVILLRFGLMGSGTEWSVPFPLAAIVASGAIEPGDIARAEVEADILILTVEV